MYPTVVITAAVPWDGITARPQHLARQLAGRGWPVLFVEPPVTLIGPFRNPSLRDKMLPKTPVAEVQSLGDGQIRVLQPMTTIPFYHMARFVNRFNQRLLARQIRQHVHSEAILLSNLPSSVDLIPWLSPVATFYDCVDDHGAFGGLTRSDVIEALEADMSYQSRAVFATADALVEKMRRFHNDVYLVPNAVELDHFAQTSTATPHADLCDIPSPRVGFVGGIGAWLDFDLLYNLATLRKDVQFVFVGPVETDVSRIRALPNVHFLGRKPYAQLPEFLAGFDACLYPFANTKLTESVNPVKVYEYLAAGKEVIATPTREMSKFTDHVWLTPDATTAAAAITAILSGQRRSDLQLREMFLREQTWSARGSQIESVILRHLPDSMKA
ncbi:glycosyltransferase [Alicyclobacillus fastidiosus]|uniref:Glycosyltransferase n=1 Tax=Alicyclobacillus fastidiosus TaxID=392011 RepID=A0ABY6ZDT2_9BACL|nr:glycosyltransferase [Alicyclobacillus fastidiosus]WAH40885.1 glycosyltransferase [Alicyclobacillus fastidiosus]GMA62375.1 glycosyl transferase [Alicyclobacillus fastidiosus]